MKVIVLVLLCSPCLLFGQFYTFKVRNQSGFIGSIVSIDSMKIYVHELTLGAVEIDKSALIEQSILQDSLFVEIKANDRIISGLVTSIASDNVRVLSTSLGLLTIQRNQMQSIKQLSGSPDGRYDYPNPHPTRYFFGPSAIPLRKGEKYYQNAYVLSNSIQLGVSDHVSLGGGVVLPFLFYVTPKIGYRVSESVHIGAGVLAATSFNAGINVGFGIGYGSVTFGSFEHNVTTSIGLGTFKEQSFNMVSGNYTNKWVLSQKPIVSVSGMSRVSNRIMLITENWIVSASSQTSIISAAGIRFLARKNSFDFGILSPVFAGESFLAIPYIDYVIKF